MDDATAAKAVNALVAQFKVYANGPDGGYFTRLKEAEVESAINSDPQKFIDQFKLAFAAAGLKVVPV